MDHQRHFFAETRMSNRARLCSQRMQPSRNAFDRQSCAGGNRSPTLSAMILLPANGDNAAIATRRLEPGESFPLGGAVIRVQTTVLEGHRVAAREIAAGDLILSWGLPFGRALRAILPGEYLCNARILEILKERHVDFNFPAQANFENYRLPFQLDEQTFRPGEQTPLYEEPRYFEGYLRSS